MQYFKNTELAKIHHVSEKSVRNWIESAKIGKIELQLFEVNGKHHIANTSTNTFLIEELVQKGKKYKNSRGFKVVKPTEYFYKAYDRRQVLDIASNLNIRKEVPYHYCYLDGGADAWDRYSNKLSREHTPNILNRTSELLNLSRGYIDKLVGPGRKINVIDLGPGNGTPIRSTLERLLEADRLNRYIAVDISPTMLEILKRNIKSWFGDKIKVEDYLRDFEEERFNDITLAHVAEGADAPANLIFFLGGTLSNFRQPNHLLSTISRSMQGDDLLLYSGYLDTPHTRRFFDFYEVSGAKRSRGVSDEIADLLGLDDSICDHELLFDEASRCRFEVMKPKKDVTMEFSIDGRTRYYVEINKSEPIIVWRHQHYYTTDLIELFTKNDFDVIQATKSEDQDYILLISKIKAGNH